VVDRHFTGAHAPPTAHEASVTPEDHCAALVAGVGDSGKHVSPIGLQWQVPDLVDSHRDVTANELGTLVEVIFAVDPGRYCDEPRPGRIHRCQTGRGLHYFDALDELQLRKGGDAIASDRATSL